MLEFNWKKEWNDNGHWEYWLYCDKEMIGSVIPEYKGRVKKWKVTYLDRKPYLRNSLKIGKRELKWIHTQYSNNNIAVFSD